MDRSLLINDEEHRKFTSLIDNKCKILCVAVASLYVVNTNEWKFADSGLVTLIKDNSRKNYFIQLFNMDKSRFSYEFEVLWNCRYEVSENQIHIVKTDEENFVIKFVEQSESNIFSSEVKKIIYIRNAQREKKRLTQQLNSSQNGNLVISVNPELKLDMKYVNRSIRNAQTAKVKISKEDISDPTNFVYLEHMGFDNHFFKDPNDANQKKYLIDSKLDKLLDDDRSRKDIYDFIEKHGGLSQLENEMKHKKTIERNDPQITKILREPQKITPPPPPARPSLNQYTTPSIPPYKSNPPTSAPSPPPPSSTLVILLLDFSKPSQNKPSL